jgi:hypothetical protein
LGAGVRPAGLIKVRDEFGKGSAESAVSFPLSLNLVNHLLSVGDDVGGNQDTTVGTFEWVDTLKESVLVRKSKPDTLSYGTYPGLEPGTGNTGLLETAKLWGGRELTEVSVDMGNHVGVA